MSEQKHTKGPWGYQPRNPKYKGYSGFTVYQQEILESGIDRFTLLATVHDSENAEANARLIAAAPELLAACKAVMAEIFNSPRFMHGDAIIDGKIKFSLNNAITKTEGGSCERCGCTDDDCTDKK
jgi:hypothetical protein